MSYLTINGLSVGLALTSVTKTRDVIGAGVTRAQDGSARNNFNAKKWHLKGKTTPLTQTEAMLLRALLDGLGDHWSFDTDLYSDKGILAPGVRITSAPTPKYGAGALQLGTGGTFTFTLADSVSDGWTIIVWNYESSAWHHYVGFGVNDSIGGGTWYRDGVAHAAPSWWTTGGNSTISGTTLFLDLVNEGTDFIDDLVVIPAQCSAAQAASLYSFCSSNAWPTPFPALKVGGDFHSVSLTMLGQPGDGSISEVFLSGALQDNAVELAFDLMES